MTTALKGAITPMGAAASVLTTPVALDFCEALRPATVLGKLTGVVKMPFNVKCLAAASGTTASWRGEGVPAPLSAMNFDTDSLSWATLDALAVITSELARTSAPGAELIIAGDVIKAMALAVDKAFLDPESAGIAGVKPASVTSGAPVIHSTGSTVAQVDADLRGALEAVGDADLATAAWCMRPKSAIYLSTLRGSGGAPAYPGVTAKGGVLLGLPVLTSSAVGPDSNSPEESFIALVVAGEVGVADDQQAMVSYADAAAVQMLDNPSSSASTMVSLWQSGLIGIKGSRIISWRRRRSVAAAVINGIQF